VDPCKTSTLDVLPSFTSMSTSVLVGTAVTQAFTEPTDSISLLYDSIFSHYTLITLPDIYSGPTAGSNICGDRSYSIDSGCSGFLSISTSVSVNKPMLSL